MNATRHVPEGRNVTTDNFFTSLSLARELRKRNLTLLGTIRSHSWEIPSVVRSHHNRELYSSKFLFTTVDQTPVQLMSHKAKKNKVVLMISSAHNSGSIDQSDSTKKPEVIFQYNKTKCGVDVVEKMLGNYSVKYKSRRWHFVFFLQRSEYSMLQFIFALFRSASRIWKQQLPQKNTFSDRLRD